MTSIALALALASQSPSPDPSIPTASWFGGRVYTAPDGALHVGIRPAAFLDNENDGAWEIGVGATLKVTFIGW